MTNRTWLFALTLGLAVTLNSMMPTTFAACPEDAPPGTNLLLFASFRNGDFASSLHAVRADGTGECRISKYLTGRPNVLDPAVSPDGEQVAFVRGGSDHLTSIWVMNADGTSEHLLASNVTKRFHKGRAAPVWSPDGSRIAYTAGLGKPRTIHVMKADGSGDRDLGSGSSASWSPDGSRIAFMDELGSESATAIWTMRPDGSDRQRLTDDVQSAYPAWSPDGEQIVFSRAVGTKFDLFVINIGSGKLRAITQTPARSESHARWSPDGRSIAFEAKPDDSPSGWQSSIYVVAASGGAARQVTPSKFNDFSPTWWIVRSAARAATDAGSIKLGDLNSTTW